MIIDAMLNYQYAYLADATLKLEEFLRKHDKKVYNVTVDVRRVNDHYVKVIMIARPIKNYYSNEAKDIRYMSYNLTLREYAKEFCKVCDNLLTDCITVSREVNDG